MADLPQEQASTLFKIVMLLMSLIAGVLAFIPYAVHTSPLDAVMLNVPGDQGNWWHLLIGAPFFLAFLMIWLRLRAFFSKELSTSIERRVIWTVTILCVCGRSPSRYRFCCTAPGQAKHNA